MSTHAVAAATGVVDRPSENDSSMAGTPAEGDDPVVLAMTAGDAPAFTALVERHERELQCHCRRMLRSSSEAEDAVQETFLRAWRARATFEGRASLRTWLYRIATNTCLDQQRRRSYEPEADTVAPAESEPETAVVARQTYEAALLTTLHALPPRQRAVVVLRDAFGWSAADAAGLLDTTVPAANSALQRARATLRARARRDASEVMPSV